ncbi:hypothetical protein J3458_001120 [Metarhizium acridum]|uniref:uncharacterized protein n=1 Tax=Metarhizium acridum TaxID=92637 RepID=UPI001C6C31B5|nr:hypothetical protein J3458_001120 [Metarhizium acridum]
MIYDAGAYLSGNTPGSTWTAQYFEGNNYYIYIRGKNDPNGNWWLSEESPVSSDATGGVLVNCHFDSVATSYGATDDGVACVSMLQLLGYFTSDNHQPENGVVLLFNNAEEDGLLGSRAFSRSPLVQFCRTFVNLEGVGAGGRAMLFRTTDVTVAMAYSGSPHPFGSIIANEGFDRGAIMSGTDYEIFADTCGLRGLDIAFYHPRSRYHTTEDDARHTSIDSVWHMMSAALATTKKLSEDTSTILPNVREHPEEVDKGVWFDWLGSVWIAFPLKWLFGWSLMLLVVTPLVVAFLACLLVREDEYCLDEVWRDFIRFLISLVFAVTLDMGPLIAVATFNPLIMHSGSYTIWLMTLSSSYFGFWFIIGNSVHLTRLSILFGLFSLSWGFQVFAATVEHRFGIGSFYSVTFFHSAIFLSLVLSFLEQLALQRKQIPIQGVEDADQPGESDSQIGARWSEEDELTAADATNDGERVSVRVPLLGTNESQYESTDGSCFGSACRRFIARLSSSAATMYEYHKTYGPPSSSSIQPLEWAWFLQLLILAPVHLILVGSQGLAAITAIAMTGPDGSNLLTPFVVLGSISIVLILPLAPFMRQITYHVPMLLFFTFIGTLAHSLTAFPFSNDSRFRFIFQQSIDLDKGTNTVTLSGVEDFLRLVIDSLPEGTSQSIKCQPTVGRALVDCQYYVASSHLPDLANGADLHDAITVVLSKSEDEITAHIQLDALETRTCYLDFSRPLSSFTVRGEAKRDPRLSQTPPDGQIQHIQLWRRSWGDPWNLDVQVAQDQRLVMNEDYRDEISLSLARNEPNLRSEATGLQHHLNPPVQSLEMTVRCSWSDANNPKTIPALHHLQQYMPPWAIVTKRGFSLVEVKKRYKVI